MPAALPPQSKPETAKRGSFSASAKSIRSCPIAACSAMRGACRVAKPRRSVAAQVGHQHSVAGLRQRRRDVVPRVNVVGKTVQQDDREIPAGCRSLRRRYSVSGYRLISSRAAPGPRACHAAPVATADWRNVLRLCRMRKLTARAGLRGTCSRAGRLRRNAAGGRIPRSSAALREPRVSTLLRSRVSRLSALNCT